MDKQTSHECQGREGCVSDKGLVSTYCHTCVLLSTVGILWQRRFLVAAENTTDVIGLWSTKKVSTEETNTQKVGTISQYKLGLLNVYG